jgi:hypothetical protein
MPKLDFLGRRGIVAAVQGKAIALAHDRDSIPDLVGWEHHGNPAYIPGLEVVARGPVCTDYTANVLARMRG